MVDKSKSVRSAYFAANIDGHSEVHVHNSQVAKVTSMVNNVSNGSRMLSAKI